MRSANRRRRIRLRSTSYVALVFDASEASGELEQRCGAGRRRGAQDAAKAVLERSLFFVVRRASACRLAARARPTASSRRRCR
jgi:hypothetical protein